MNKEPYPRILFNFTDKKLEIEIETEHLYIRSYKDEDFEDCAALYSDEKLTRYFDHGSPRSRHEIEELVREKGSKYFNTKQPFGLFSIFEKNNHAFVGQADLLPTEEQNVVEVGCIFLRRYHQTGYAQETVKIIAVDFVEEINKQFFKDKECCITKVIATTHPKNFPPQKILRNIGMTVDKQENRFGLPRLWYSYTLKNYAQIQNTHIQPAWNPKEYSSHSSAQITAALQLLQQIKFQGDEQVLDVGCGDGKITAHIETYLKKGSILGIDNSQEMISFSKNSHPQINHPNLVFQVQNAECLNYEKKFDIIFSSFALQWLNNPNSFFAGAYKGLKPSGRLIATIPLGISSSLETAVQQVTTSQKWISYFINFHQKQLMKDIEYTNLLAANRFSLSLSSTVTQEVVFSSRKKFECYVLQWFPYLQTLPDSLKAIFFQEIIDQYLHLEPLLDEGKVMFRFPRLDVIAKPIP